MNTQKRNGFSKKIMRLPTFNLELFGGKREGHLFANGNMQVGIIINIQAATDNEEVVTLSPEQLNSIELVNKITGEKLSGDWQYSSEENDYRHQFPGRSITRDTNLSYGKDALSDDSEPQKKIYWLKTKKSELIEIIAKVTLDGETYSSDDSHYKGSHIVVTGHEPITYHFDDLVPTPQIEENVAYGTYELKRTITVIDILGGEHTQISFQYPEWTQNNYYLFPKKGQGYAIHDVEIRNTINDEDTFKYDYRRFTHHTRSNNLYLWFLWGTYSAKRTAGAAYRVVINDSPDLSSSLKREATPQEEIVTTTRTDVVSLSRLYFESPGGDNFWVDEADQIPQFKFRDIYGNESVFLKIIMDNADSFHLREG
ncbi:MULTISPECIES: hypothetical protein [Xenorhabdus]|uniref:Uncharacterized protein n=1 Tax=Xenorhabdus ehlersii TaxID=290111 RepID=A0A2D0IY55_9GAMM|nr:MULTISPECIES: hypothetical protein [Xenorhabdus]MBC8947814.1 hypothetical protein [Xenorhabdus sp. TS4]MBC8948784.1 hypothetical protein [Xenorhabdus sp. TS4]PHM25300.1 hypothetical protein Xehl_01515 [Xenorhabdus ehlersii]PHM26877.1 hypothetical protein Xehl_00573 [Xenorhabdus ehlersii]RKE90431.1 hypothetical protein BDE27_2294 [Xenorhabdus ehlersii]